MKSSRPSCFFVALLLAIAARAAEPGKPQPPQAAAPSAPAPAAGRAMDLQGLIDGQLKAGRGEVTGNKITHGWMAAVLVSPEYWWSESASSSDVVIAGNVVNGCRRAAIEIVAPGGDGQPLPAGAHRNISIVGNTITASAWPNIMVTSTEGLVIKDNRLTPREPDSFVPPLAWGWDWKQTKPAAVVTEQCR